MTDLNIPTAEAFRPLEQPSRYKGVWGGRGSGKSHHMELQPRKPRADESHGLLAAMCSLDYPQPVSLSPS